MWGQTLSLTVGAKGCLQVHPHVVSDKQPRTTLQQGAEEKEEEKNSKARQTFQAGAGSIFQARFYL